MSTPGNLVDLLGAAFQVDPLVADSGPIPEHEIEIEEYEDKLVLAELLNAEGWEARSDSEWGTAPAVAPLTPASAVTEPVIATRFDDIFDQATYDESKSRAMPFKMLTGRYDPFEFEHLRQLVDEPNHSAFLRRPIITFKDALDHSLQLCIFWYQEDEEADEARQDELEESTERGSITHTVEEIAALKQAWKDAVADRKILLEEQDKIVAEKRRAYRAARGIEN